MDKTCVTIYKTGTDNPEGLFDIVYFDPDIGKSLGKFGDDIPFNELKDRLINAEEQELNYTAKLENPLWWYGVNRRQWGKVDSLTETDFDSMYQIVQKECPTDEELMTPESGLLRNWSNRLSRSMNN